MYASIVVREIRRLVKKHGTTKLVIIAGGAPGIDSLAKATAHKQNVHVAEVEALWEIRGKGAGPQRNLVMALLEPDEVIAIHSDIKKSKGTARMLKIAKSLNIPSRVVAI
jgi:hypothetical protein